MGSGASKNGRPQVDDNNNSSSSSHRDKQQRNLQQERPQQFENRASHRTLLYEEFQETEADKTMFHTVSTDPDNNLVFAALQECTARHCPMDQSGISMLLSIEPDKQRKTLILTLTNGVDEYYYCVRRATDIIQDKEKFFQSVRSSMGEEAVTSLSQMEKWTRFMGALFQVTSPNIHFQSTESPTLHLQLAVDSARFSLLQIPLKALPHAIIKKKLPIMMFSMLEQTEALERQQRELRERNETLERELKNLQPSTANGTKKPVFQAFPKSRFDSVDQSRALEFFSDDKSFEVPLQKVLEILQNWKSVLDTSEGSKVDYVMDVIQKDSLYDIDVDSLMKKASDDETKFWIQSELFSKPSTKKFNRMLKAYSKIITFSNALMNIVQEDRRKPDLGLTAEIEKAMENVESYDFDIFNLSKVTNGKPLSNLALKLFEKHDLVQKFSIPIKTLRAFFERIESGYLNNPYHNKTHAADVMQTLHVYLTGTSVVEQVTKLDMLAALVAAAIHDYGHPGVNNKFEIMTGSENALLYNDQSVLENYHLTQTFMIMKEDKYNIFVNLTDEERRYVRDIIISMALATDIGQHFALLKDIKTGILKNFTSTKKEDMHMMLKLLIKCADVSNPTKKQSLAYTWAENVVEEFYCQGDKERELGLPLSPFMDRTKPALARCQLGFIDYIAMPLFECLAQFDTSLQYTAENLKRNKTFWGTELEKENRTA